MRTRRIYFVLAALASLLCGSLLSLRATAESSPSRASVFVAGRPRAPLPVQLHSTRAGLKSAAAGPGLQPVLQGVGAPVHVDPLRELAPIVAFGQRSEDEANPQGAQSRVLAWIKRRLGLGAGASTTTAVLAWNGEPPPDRQCADPIRLCTPEGIAQAGGSMPRWSRAAIAIGAAGAITGVALVLSSNRETGQQTSIGPEIYKRGGGLSLKRTW